MNLDDFIANFHTLARAPGGVDRLRELILQLAVQGKLVAQDPNDEPASVLLERIRKEKARLVKEGKVRKSKTLPPVEEDEVPFEVPEGWEWTRFTNTATICSNLVDPAGYGAMPHIAPNNIEKGTGRLLAYHSIASDGVTSSKHLFFPGQILYSKIRPNLSKAVIINFSGLCSADMYPLEPHIDTRYLHTYILSSSFLGFAKQDDNRVAMPKLNQEQLLSIPVPTPPLAEQHRIVARVDELMALCDELEAHQNSEEATLRETTASALDALLNAADAEDFEQAWNRVYEHFDTLFDTPESIEGLRQAVLQLAVQGKLLRTESLMLESVVGDHVEFLNGFAFKSEWYTDFGVRLVRNINVSHGVLDWSKTTRISESMAEEYQRFALDGGDIVISLDRPIISTGVKVARVREADLPCLLLQRVAKPVFKNDSVLPDYFFLWLRSPEYVDSIDPGRSNGIPHISTRQLSKLPLLVPPLAEQHRIVARVDELMALCDELEARLRAARDTSEALAAAMVHHFEAATESDIRSGAAANQVVA